MEYINGRFKSYEKTEMLNNIENYNKHMKTKKRYINEIQEMIFTNDVMKTTNFSRLQSLLMNNFIR